LIFPILCGPHDSTAITSRNANRFSLNSLLDENITKTKFTSFSIEPFMKHALSILDPDSVEYLVREIRQQAFISPLDFHQETTLKNRSISLALRDRHLLV